MNRTALRHLASTGVVGILASLLVVFTPQAAQAADAIAVSEWERHWTQQRINGDYRSLMVNAPSSQLSAVNANLPDSPVMSRAQQNITTAQRNAYNVAKGGTKPGISLSTVGKSTGKLALKGAGVVGAGFMALELSYSGTHWAMDAFGFKPGSTFNAGTTGNIICDVRMLAGSGCKGTIHPDYTINDDVKGYRPGWVGSHSANPVYQTGVLAGSGPLIYVNVLNAPAYGQSGAFDYLVTYAPPSGDYRDICGSSGMFGATLSGMNPTGSSFFSQNIASTTNWWPNPCNASSGPINQVSFNRSTGTQQMGKITLTVGSELVGTWYPVGHALRPPDVESNPIRRWVTTYRCSGGSGGTKTSDTFRESDAEWPTPPSPSCSQGLLEYIKVVQRTDGLADDQVIYEWEIDPATTTWLGDNPDCWDGSCLLELFRVDPVTSKELSCFANPSLCVDWMKDPNKEENYECRYGGKSQPLDECLVYGPTFNPEGTPELGDPETGDKPVPVPQPPGSPDPQPPVNPSPQPPKDNSCPPAFTWTSLVNPWYYYKGTVCALQEAFVPKNSAASVQRINRAAAATTPALWVDAAGGMFDGIQAGTGDCRGPGMHWGVFNRDVYPLNACTDPGKKIANWSRILTGVGLVVLGSMACVRAVGSGFGWKPSAGGDS